MDPRMNIRPLDILFMLDDKDLAEMESSDLIRLCNAVTIDLQFLKEGKLASKKQLD